MQGMLLAAGLGTRLQPLSEELPKAAVPVLNQPIGTITLQHLASAGIDHVVTNTHHAANQVRDTLISHLPQNLELAFSHEATLLGTGGGLHQAQQYFRHKAGPVVVANADVLFAPDIKRALATHLETEAIATMILRQTPDPRSWGAIESDENGRVRRMLDKPPRIEMSTTPYMFSGVHILSARAFDDLPKEGCVIREGYIPWLKRGEVIASIVDAGPWSDLGTPARYLKANLNALEGTWPHLHPDINEQGSLIDPSAKLAQSARIQKSVIGANASIGEGVDLEECVVWPNAHISEDATRAIITPTQTISI